MTDTQLMPVVTVTALTEPRSSATTCLVCGSRDSTQIYQDARDPITRDSFQIVQCSDCGVIYTTPRPPSMDRYYPLEYRAFGPLVAGVLRALYGWRVSRWVRQKPQGSSVLEIGCGPGLMLAEFQRRGWRVTGIERNNAAAAAARQLVGSENVAISTANLADNARFDLVVLFHVLEHIDEPLIVLRECAKRLAPGGLLIVNVPNFSSWQSRFAQTQWMHLDVPRHLAHYTPDTLATTFDRAGLKLLTLSFVSLEHDPYGWVESTISRLTGRTNTLARFLTGLDKFSSKVFFSSLLGAFLFLPAMLLAGLSWLAGRGALMEAVAVTAGESVERRK